MRCRKCGKELEEEVKFCPQCGTKVNQSQSEKGRKRIFAILIVVVLLAVIVFVIRQGPTGGEKSNPEKAEKVKNNLTDVEEEGSTQKRDSLIQYLALVKHDGKYGFMDETGEEIIPCQYDRAYSFNKNGLAPVGIIRDGREYWGYINESGEEVIPLEYDDAVMITENDLVAVGKLSDENDEESEKNWEFFNSTGEKISDLEYQFEEKPDLSNELAFVEVSCVNEDGDYIYGVIDEQGKKILELGEYIIATDDALGNCGMIAVARISSGEF